MKGIRSTVIIYSKLATGVEVEMPSISDGEYVLFDEEHLKKTLPLASCNTV